MDTFNCPECNDELLLLPDLKAMSKMIAEHVHKHRASMVTMSKVDMVKLLKLESILTRCALEKIGGRT